MKAPCILPARATLWLVALISVLDGLAQTSGTALVRHAPTLNGGFIEGSVQQMLPESVTLNGTGVITGDLLVPGSPTVRLNGKPTYGGTLDADGSATPANYQVTLNGNASLRHTVRRTNAVPVPAVSAPPLPAGTRAVSINSSGQSVSDFTTLRDLTLNAAVGRLAIPPGTYGDFTANGASGFTLGVAGSADASVYNFQRLTLNGQVQLQVVGPVVITVASGLIANGEMGSLLHPDWLTLRICAGGMTLNGGASFYGYVSAPDGTLTINGGGHVVGGVTVDRLTMNGNGRLKLSARVSSNQLPTVLLSAPSSGSSFTAPANFTLAAVASDPDGTVTRVEFYRDTAKLGEDAIPPFELSVVNLAVGNFQFVARAYDNRGGVTDSSPVMVSVTSPNQLPTVALLTPVDGAVYSGPATVMLSATASDTDGAIARVEYFRGVTKIGESGTAPFAFSWLSVPPGAYTLTAKAIDTGGASAESGPRSITVQAVLPYFTGFEPSDGFVVGPLAGQGGWTTTGGAVVTETNAYTGLRGVTVAGAAPPGQIGHAFPPYAGQSIVFADLFVRPVAGRSVAAATVLQTDVARMALVQNGSEGEWQVLNGDGIGGGAWETVGDKVPLAADGRALAWHRLTVRMDFASKRFDVYAGGRLIAFDLGFSDSARSLFEHISLQGHVSLATSFDDILAGFDNPLFLDSDKDGLDDRWEVANGMSPAVNDRNADQDADGLTNIREYILGTRANVIDSDGDGMPDGWEHRYGLNPGVNDANGDSDGDGWTNLQEYQLGRNPIKGAMSDTAGVVNLRLYSPSR